MSKKYGGRTEAVDSGVYSVGAAARLTGLSTSTVRNWERRYEVVQPRRLSNGQRRFSAADVSRLGLLARLTRAGHSISALAAQSDAELAALLDEVDGRPTGQVGHAAQQPLRVVTVGARAGAHLQALTEDIPRLDLVRQFPFAQDLDVPPAGFSCDVLVVHTVQIRPETADWLRDLRSRLQPAHVVVVYEFARLAQVRALRNESTSVLQGFGHLEPFLRIWLPGHVSVDTESAPRPPAEEGDGHKSGARRYTGAMLSAYLNAKPSGLLCDCQRHLARMLQQIYDFEDYTDQCADQSEEDRRAHQEIRAVMHRARAQVEDALLIACTHVDSPGTANPLSAAEA